MSVTVRFAPSPTGFLHIGGARTALFNYLYARHFGGAFRLRIEDTDRVRSTTGAVAAILDGLAWLGLDHDGDIVRQSERAPRHAEVARQLLAAGRAYYCYCSPAELAAMRVKQKAEGRSTRYEGIWRDRDLAEAPSAVPPVIRLKAPQSGETVIRDHVQGEVTVSNAQLDDLIILRADATPTYNLSVVVDDHDMAISHVIRGDDHLNNAFRQTQIYRAMGWKVPEFAHVPLIHGGDGAKLSKRHGALGIDAYRDMGYLPEALRNYLLRLGWSHGDDEIISTEQAIAWFDIDAIGRGPARFDFVKLDSLNGRYIRLADDARLADLLVPPLERLLGHAIDSEGMGRLRAGMAGLKSRARTLVELAANARFYVAARPLALDEKAQRLVARSRQLLCDLLGSLSDIDWSPNGLEAAIRAFAEAGGHTLGAIAQPLRAALTGSAVSPPVFEVMATLGRGESLGRMADAVGDARSQQCP
jgi:glutamyl-tRNA synthetase